MTQSRHRYFSSWQMQARKRLPPVYVPPPPDPDPPPPDPDGEGEPSVGTPPINPVNYQSIRGGYWSNPSTWKGGLIPNATSDVTISTTHTVVFDVAETKIAGITIQDGATLRFPGASDNLLRTTKNVRCFGTLYIDGRIDPSKRHVIRFEEIDESKFVGSGMDIAETDIGLWVMGNGKLELRGYKKTPWTRTTASVPAGATSYTVQSTTNWRVGDQIVIVPMEVLTISENYNDSWSNTLNCPIDPHLEKFEVRTITNIVGNTVHFAEPLKFSHNVESSIVESAAYGNQVRTWYPEVGNLTRNIHYGGTKDPGTEAKENMHRAHLFIRSTQPQVISYVSGEWIGPRNIQPRHKVRPERVNGRYGIHFHHCMNGSVGSIVEGCALYNAGNRMYVPHMSHGITMRDNISFNTVQEAFWWDFQERTHNTLWKGNLIMCCRRNGLDNNSRGMLLQMGDDNVAEDNVCVYAHTGDFEGGGAYAWDADTEGVWMFRRNLAHSCGTGIFVWQNTSHPHIVLDYEAFNCFFGIFHGAYINSYLYVRGFLKNAILDLKAVPGLTIGAYFERYYIDPGNLKFGAQIHDSPISNSESSSNKFVKCVFKKGPNSVAALRSFTLMPDSNQFKSRKYADMILCEHPGQNAYYMDNGTPDGPYYTSYNLKDGTQVRVQGINPPYYKTQRVLQQNVTTNNIAQFAPVHYGTGSGLSAEYHNDDKLAVVVLRRIDTMIMMQAWDKNPKFAPDGVHHLVPGEKFSMRWTGKVEAQWTEPHKFIIVSGGGFRLWINNVLMLDSWVEKATTTVEYESNTMSMVAGQKYDIKLEHFNSTPGRKLMLYWKSPSMPVNSIIPMSQLYPS